MSLSSDLDRFDYMVRNYSLDYAVTELTDLAADPVIAAAHTQMEIGRLAILARVRQLNNENDL